ncbi:conserved hypothetical protein [Paecilomyces variotii No. 5]|uniref:Pal1 cell morphology protein-domain-containing protein n=1 Tax=Byssochlamys spectabilis (strain No. 5 / NBRC 109023) TaxID=1356009 RepID=V5FBS2_BYSSN|nr:conserved hypothetical protein [Paecilomyces variotii No. 5]
MNTSTNPFRRAGGARPRPMTMFEPAYFPVNPFEDPIPAPKPVERSSPVKNSDSLHRSRSLHHGGSVHGSSRHSRRRDRVRPDVIDRLDDVADIQYHHEGPYDAVYPERNRNSKRSPVEAVRESNAMTLKATPADMITDSIQRHRPLDGVAFFPPGHSDRDGHVYEYEEGPNMVGEEYGNFMRMPPGFKFTEEDFKNDPFYNRDFQPKRRLSLRKALGFGRSRRVAA